MSILKTSLLHLSVCLSLCVLAALPTTTWANHLTASASWSNQLKTTSQKMFSKAQAQAQANVVGQQAQPPAMLINCRVSRVIDGKSFICVDFGKNKANKTSDNQYSYNLFEDAIYAQYRVSLYGIDTFTPYWNDVASVDIKINLDGKNQSKIDSYVANEQHDLGVQSKENLNKLLNNKNVILKIKGGLGLSTYNSTHGGKVIADVYVNGKTLVNLQQVQQGYAWSFTTHTVNDDIQMYLNAEKQARTNRVGLWKL